MRELRCDFFLLLSSLGKVILSWPHAVCEQRWRLADTGTELAEISLEALCASFFLFFCFCFVFLDTFGDRNCLGFLIFNFGRGEGSLACALSLGTAMSTRKASLTEKQAKNGTSKYVLERCASINEYYDIAFKVCISVLLCLCSGGACFAFFVVLQLEQVCTFIAR